jgi:hypothetical protein
MFIVMIKPLKHKETPFFSNTRQNGEWTETITRQDEKDLAMFGE